MPELGRSAVRCGIGRTPSGFGLSCSCGSCPRRFEVDHRVAVVRRRDADLRSSDHFSSRVGMAMAPRVDDTTKGRIMSSPTLMANYFVAESEVDISSARHSVRPAARPKGHPMGCGIV
jgi:hypothetical protein